MGNKYLLLIFLLPLMAAGQDNQRYIVELSGDPVAEHVARESKRTGRRLAMDGEAARSRRSALRGEQRVTRASLEKMGVKVISSTETVSNTLIVEMPDELADKVAALPGVKRVRKSRTFRAELDHAIPIHKVTEAWNQVGVDKAGLGVKIAIIDSGIESGHPGMKDSDLPMPEGFPKVNADTDMAFTSNKIIVARSYASLFSTVEDDISARDVVGHGTATAMAAAGVRNVGPLGPIQGVAPKAYLGSYKVLGANGSGTSDIILKAVDDAVADGMDVISASISSAIAAPRLEDDIEVDAFERVTRLGVLMINSAGNKGDPNTIGSPATAPSVITVGASFNDRTFFPASYQVAGGPVVGAITFSNAASPADGVTGPLVDIATIDEDGEACLPFPLGSLTGKVALILRSPAAGGCTFETKLNDVGNAGAIGALVYTRPERPFDFGTGYSVGTATLPALLLFNSDGLDLKRRIAANPDLVVKLSFQIASIAAFSDGVADFSSKGPNVDGSIKPDLVAVGTDFYTAAETTTPGGELYGPSGYTITDGTSFAAPLVAGAAALLKSARPGLTAAQYRSLLINTAAPITARVQESGGGLLDMGAALKSTFAVAPVSLGLGVGGASPNLSKTLVISNVGAAAESYSLTVAPRDSGVPAPVLGSSTVTIQPGQTASVPVTFTGSGMADGQYEGFVKIRGSVSGIEGRVPYWYGIPSNIPATITPLFVKGFSDGVDYRAGARVTNAIYFRVTDKSGIVIPDPQPVVTAVSGGGTVVSTVSLDRNLPGVFSVTVQLGVRRGDNIFSISAGSLEPLEIVITGN
jgi:subtilisin family serine protease